MTFNFNHWIKKVKKLKLKNENGKSSKSTIVKMKKIIENAMAKNLMYTNFGIWEKKFGV